MNWFKPRKKRDARGAAMVEGALMFPVLITLYGAIMMTSRAHLNALAMQGEARAEIWSTCVAPPRLFATPFGAGMTSLAYFPPIIAPDSKVAPFHDWNIDNSTKYSPAVVVGALPAMQWGSVNPKQLTLDLYKTLSNASSNMDEIFKAPRGRDMGEFKKLDYNEAYIAFTGNSKGFSAHFCQRLEGDPMIWVDEYSAYNLFDQVQNYMIAFLPAQSQLSFGP